jgi:hypothetical protein
MMGISCYNGKATVFCAIQFGMLLLHLWLNYSNQKLAIGCVTLSLCGVSMIDQFHKKAFVHNLFGACGALIT